MIDYLVTLVFLDLPGEQFYYCLKGKSGTFVGYRAVVPWRKGVRIGVIIAQKTYFHVPHGRQVIELGSEGPLLTPSQLQLLHFVPYYYICSISTFLRSCYTGLAPWFKVNVGLGPSYTPYGAYSPVMSELCRRLGAGESILFESIDCRYGELLYSAVERGILTLLNPITKVRRVGYYYQQKGVEEGLVEKLSTTQRYAYDVVGDLRSHPCGITRASLLQQGVSSHAIHILKKKGLIQTYRGRERGTPSLGSIGLNMSRGKCNASQIKQRAELPLLISGEKEKKLLDWIDQVMQKGGQLLLVVPDPAWISYYQALLHRYQPMRVDGSSFAVRRKIWLHLYKGLSALVITHREGLLLPYTQLRGVVIIAEGDRGHKSYVARGHNPTWHRRDLALYLADTQGASVLLWGGAPSLISWYNVQRGKYHLHYRKVQCAALKLFTSKYNVGERIALLLPLIETKIANRKRVAILYDPPHHNNPIRCSKCGWQVRCNRCEGVMTLYEGGLSCLACGLERSYYHRCINCGSAALQQHPFAPEDILAGINRGVGIDQALLLQKNEEDPYVLLAPFLTGETKCVILPSQWLPMLKGRVDEWIIPFWEHYRYGNTFRAEEYQYRLLWDLMQSRSAGVSIAVSKGRREELLRLRYAIEKESIDSYYQELLQERNRYHYPPSYRRVLLYLRGVDYYRAKGLMQQIERLLCGVDDIRLSGPKRYRYDLQARGFTYLVELSVARGGATKELLKRFYSLQRTWNKWGIVVDVDSVY